MLTEVKGQVERKRAAHRTIEGKATTLIGFATALLAFATSKNTGPLTWASWQVLTVVLLLLVSIIVAAMSRTTATYNTADASLFNTGDSLADANNEARIAMALTEKWAIIEREIDAIGETKALRLEIATKLFLAAIIVISAATIFIEITPPRRDAGAGNGATTRTSVSPVIKARPIHQIVPLALPKASTSDQRNLKVVAPKMATTAGAKSL